MAVAGDARSAASRQPKVAATAHRRPWQALLRRRELTARGRARKRRPRAGSGHSVRGPPGSGRKPTSPKKGKEGRMSTNRHNGCFSTDPNTINCLHRARVAPRLLAQRLFESPPSNFRLRERIPSRVTEEEQTFIVQSTQRYDGRYGWAITAIHPPYMWI